MKNLQEYRIIYRAVLDTLETSPKDRQALINAVIDTFNLSKKERNDTSTNSRRNILRSMCGTVINEMHSKSIIFRDADNLYRRNEEKPVAIRIEECEEQILELLREKPRTKGEIKDLLIKHFGTDETSTQKDDNKLFTYIGQILKRLTNDAFIKYDGSVYKIVPMRTAELKNRQEMLSLKSDFLAIVHAKGGEFFEHYFMNLLEKYLVRCGKTVTESYVTGGADDGGIDGIAKTVDSLGFKETIMVQTKNRNDETSETDVRGFYGAVCAAQGSRGIFATSSDFHPMAKKLLNSIDNCVGVNGDKIFSMACDTSYGVKREGGKLVIDVHNMD